MSGGGSAANRITSYAKYLSPLSARRRPSAIRRLQPLVSRPGMISLGGGLPNPSQFPFDRLSFGVRNYPEESGSKSGDDDDKSPTTSSTVVDLSADELNTALQYSATTGIPELRQRLLQLQQREHAPAGLVQNDPSSSGGGIVMDGMMDLAITTGSQDGFCRAVEMLIDPTSPDDVVFLESPTYSGALAFLKPFGARLVPVAVDRDGMQPDSFERALREHVRLRDDGDRGGDDHHHQRRVLYTIPTAQNPSGVTMSADRRRRVYDLARQYDVMILEDDPYYYLHPNRRNLDSFLKLDLEASMTSGNNHDSNNSNDDNNNRGGGARAGAGAGGAAGRVVRFDSLSKVVSSGMRIGFCTGPVQLLERMNYHAQATCLHTSGISQMMALKVLQSWGWDGWDRHCEAAASFYTARRNALLSAAEKHLSGTTAATAAADVTWDCPEAGMFLWLNLRNIADTTQLIEEKAAAANVLFVPGQSFDPMDRPSSYVRASYSTASDADMDTAMERLARLIAAESWSSSSSSEPNKA